MAEITLTIDGKELKGEEGDSILKVCQKNDIDVPTLCHFDGLEDIGSCRMCIVEIEGSGRPRVSTSCTTPATDGMIVKTNTDKLNLMRRNILEFLLSEGSHHCMYCAASGDCELQDLAYRFEIDYIKMPMDTSGEQMPVDSTHRYLVADPKRCVLCYRCVRACNDLAGNRTLGVSNRGSHSQIIADMGSERGESSCVNCGICLQVCPTGALIGRRSSYMGRETDVDHTESTCMFCSVGCGIDVVTRNNYVIKIDGDWDKKPNNGLLCMLGRFSPLYDEIRNRANKPLIRRDDKLVESGWGEALGLVSEKLEATEKSNIGALASTQATNEALKLFAEFFENMEVNNKGIIEGSMSVPPEEECDLSDLQAADLIVVAGEDLSEGEHQVVGFLVKRNLMERDNRLAILNDDETGFIEYAHEHLRMDEIDRAIELCKSAENPMVIYGDGISKEIGAMRDELAGKAKFFWMPPGVNARGAIAAGLNRDLDTDSAKFVYILAGESKGLSDEMMSKLKDADFVVVQASYTEPWSRIADVILPMAIWSETEGTVINLEGRALEVAKAAELPAEVRTAEEILNALAENTGQLLVRE